MVTVPAPVKIDGKILFEKELTKFDKGWLLIVNNNLWLVSKSFLHAEWFPVKSKTNKVSFELLFSLMKWLYEICWASIDITQSQNTLFFNKVE